MLVLVTVWYALFRVLSSEEIYQTEDYDRLPDETEIPVPIQAVSGGRLQLPCDITSPLDGDEVYLVLWYKNEVATPIYSLDARRGQLEQARHAKSETLIDRAHFSTIPQPAELQIDRVSLDDEGLYRCRVDFRKARTQHSALLVTVVVPPGVPIIKDHNGKVLSGVIGPYNEGDNLRLICQAEGGKPPPTLIWWRGRRVVDDSYELLTPGVTRNELFISRLQRRDLMATLTCQAANNNISPPAEASVTLDIYFRPLTVHVKGKRRRLSAKKTAQFECEARGSRPPASISWRKGSNKLKNSVDKVSAQGNVTTSTLTLTLTSEDNGKFIYCQADNEAIPGSAIEDGWKLEVHYVPQLNLRLGRKLSQSNIPEGIDVYFECNVRANPWVSETGWRYEGHDLQTNLTSGVIISNQSLVLQKVTRSHKGRYSCTATNTEGQGESNYVYLRVHYTPVCQSEQESSYEGVLNHPLHIPCDVDGDPDDVSFRWEFNGTTSERVELTPRQTSGTSSTLVYVPRTEADFGTLFCWGENSVGEQKVPCQFLVIPADPPEPVNNCTTEGETESGFRVMCSHDRRGDEEVEVFYFAEIRESSTNILLMNTTSSMPDFSVSGLVPDTSYVVYLYAGNVMGKSKPVAVEVGTLAVPASQNRTDDSWEIDINAILFISFAGLGGVLFVIIVILVAVKIRYKRRSRKDSLSAQGNEKSHSSEKSGDSCSEGCTCSAREEEKIRENIPDVVVFSEKVKPEEEMVSPYSSKSAYWNRISLPSQQEELALKMQLSQSNPPWSTADWVIPSQPVEIVPLQLHRVSGSTSDDPRSERRQLTPVHSAEGSTTSSFAPLQSHPTSTAKQTDV